MRDFSSLDIGTTVFVAGIFMTVGAPMAARLTTIMDQRIVIAVGFSLFALSCWLMSGVTPEWVFWEPFAPQAIRGFSILLCIVPAVGMALNGVPPDELPFASGLFNLMRNLGGAIGIATVTTWLQDFGRITAERFGEALSPANLGALGSAVERLSSMTADAGRAKLMLSAELARLVAQQSLTMAFENVFLLMGGLFVAALLIVPFAKTVILSDDPPAAH